jgi:hypothetical protein
VRLVRLAVAAIALVFVAGLTAPASSAGKVGLISHSLAGRRTSANASSQPAAISASGRFVLLGSSSSDLIEGQIDTPLTNDFFLYDTQTRSSTLVSHSYGSRKVAANAGSNRAVLSKSARWVAFTSPASDLVYGFRDMNDASQDLFLFDSRTGAVTLVSHAPGEPTTGADQTIQTQAISPNGRFIVYTTGAQNLVDGFVDRNGTDTDVFMYDRLTGSNTLVSHRASNGAHGGDGFSLHPGTAVHNDGTIVFSSTATDLIPDLGDGNGTGADVYMYDRASDSQVLVSESFYFTRRTSDGAGSLVGVLAPSRRVVTWATFSTDHVDVFTDQNGPSNFDLFRRDMSGREVTLVSRDAQSATKGANGSLSVGFMDAMGARVVFTSKGTNHVAGFTDLNGSESDIYEYAAASERVRLISHEIGSTTRGGNGTSGSFQISQDGSVIGFVSFATNLVGPAFFADNNGSGSDVFVVSAGRPDARLVSHVPSEATSTANGTSDAFALSADGGAVLFRSYAQDLIRGFQDTNGSSGDVYLSSS